MKKPPVLFNVVLAPIVDVPEATLWPIFKAKLVEAVCRLAALTTPPMVTAPVWLPAVNVVASGIKIRA